MSKSVNLHKNVVDENIKDIKSKVSGEAMKVKILFFLLR